MAEIVNRSLSEENSILWPVSVEMTVEDKNVSIVKLEPDADVPMQRVEFPHQHFLDFQKENFTQVPVKEENDDKKRVYVCDICGTAFKRSEHLKRHSNGHSVVKPFQCNQCGSSFKRSEHLKRHMVTHMEIKPFQCVNCGKQFSRKEHLRRHMQAICKVQEC